MGHGLGMHVQMGQKKHPRLAAAIGARLEDAKTQAGFETWKDLERVTGMHDKTLRRIIGEKSEAVPDTTTLMILARALGVSIDWLVFGREAELPAGYYRFLATEAGRQTSEEAQAFLSTLPTRGYPAPVKYYVHAYAAFNRGLTRAEADRAGRRASREELEEAGYAKIDLLGG